MELSTLNQTVSEITNSFYNFNYQQNFPGPNWFARHPTDWKFSEKKSQFLQWKQPAKKTRQQAQ